MTDNIREVTPVLVCGLLAADVVFNVSTIPTEAIKHRAENVSLICGGGGCYAAVAINRLGGQAIMFTNLGDDIFGEFILSRLTSEGIDCSLVNRHADNQTSISSIAVDARGERQILNYRTRTPLPVLCKLSIEPSPRAVLVDTRWHEGSIAALEYAKKQNIPGIIDAEAPVSVEAMNLASHIAFSRQGLSDFAPGDSILAGLQKAATQFSCWVCVTDGENGTHLLRDSKLETVSAPTVNAVDTLGAGDVWHGAFSVQLAKGSAESSAVKFANVAAAIKCTRVGGGFSAPDWQEVNEFINAD